MIVYILIMDTINRALTFDDVLLIPQESSINPSDADTSIQLTKNIRLKMPILSAAMDTVTDARLAIALSSAGGLGVIHRNCTVEEEVSMVKQVREAGQTVTAACGPHDIDRALALDKAGAAAVVIDCAHAHRPDILEEAKKIKAALTGADLIIGNIVTEKAAKMFLDVADALKVGIGPGSICTTRVVAGVGVPQFTAIQAVAQIAKKKHVPVIADGGIKHSGDIIKALAAGASAVMLGGLLGATEEAPGERMEIDGKHYKTYRGMGSLGVMEERMSSDRYFQKGCSKFVPEGIEGAVPIKGTVEDVVFQLIGGLRSGMGYVGAENIQELQTRAKFIFITKAGHYESHPHNVRIIKEAPNY